MSLLPRATSLPAPRLAINALFMGALTIALAPIFVLLSQIGPSATAFWRLALGGIFIARRSSQL